MQEQPLKFYLFAKSAIHLLHRETPLVSHHRACREATWLCKTMIGPKASRIENQGRTSTFLNTS
jgi:hypothetical protein